MIALWLSLAWAQDAPAVVAEEPAPVLDAVEPAVEDPEDPEPEPWFPPADPALRTADGLPLLGPWPDDWVPGEDSQQGLPLVDVLTGEVLLPGQPHGQLAGQAGPERPPEPEPPPAAASPPDELPDPEVEPRPTPGPSPSESVSEPLPEAPARPGWTLPRAPPFNPLLSAFWLLVCGVATVVSRRAPGLIAPLRTAGLIPLSIRSLSVIAKAIAVVAGTLSVLYALPRGARSLVPWILLGVALASGIASWQLLRDLLALVVLGLERRIATGRQVALGTVAGVIETVGLRSVTLRTARGDLVTVPNWTFLSQEVHVDTERRAPVEVRLKVPGNRDRERVRLVLEELVLLSPYAVQKGRPSVRPDPEDPEVWWVQAQLLDSRWVQAFEHTLVELASERLGP